MSTVIPGRFAAHIEGPFVVFLIGFRVNRFVAVDKWLPVTKGMGMMLKSLYARKETGFLGAQPFAYWPGLALAQYWRSFEDLERFARSKEEVHLEVWKRFNKTVGVDGSVGIWHETYEVAAGRYEAVYNNMPLYGLAAATSHVPATGKRETARRRLGGENEPAVPTPT